MADGDSTFVSVVYEAELPLLQLQARSMAAFLAPERVADILVIDNSSRGMPEGVRAELMEAYGPLASLVTVLRPGQICELPPGTGWSTQQLLKLAVAAQVRTDAFVLLDAKNHLIGPLNPDFFRAPDGRLRLPSYSYATHPLRRNLEHVLRYLGLDPAPHIARFAATVTPFPLDTRIVRDMMADIESRSGRTFAREFLRNDLTEFFLYAGWILAQGRDLSEVYDLDLPAFPAIWPRGADAAGVADAIQAAAERQSPVFSVHRRALAALTEDGTAALSAFWAEKGLFASPSEAAGFVRAYQALHESEARAQARRDLPGRLLSAPRKLRRKLIDRVTRRTAAVGSAGKGRDAIR